jgi:Uma2 family endonuclease
MSTQAKPFITEEQYLEIEARAELRSEYCNGEMFLMAGGTSDHNVICFNLGAVFREQFRERPCNFYGIDIRLRVSTTGLYTYPDIMLVCGERQWADQSNTTLLNPSVIIEVLSDSTEGYDRGEKFRHYREIPSLRECILVSQKAFSVDKFTRQPDGLWSLHPHDSIEDTLHLPSVDCAVKLRDIYFKTELLG